MKKYYKFVAVRDGKLQSTYIQCPYSPIGRSPKGRILVSPITYIPGEVISAPPDSLGIFLSTSTYRTSSFVKVRHAVSSDLTDEIRCYEALPLGEVKLSHCLAQERGWKLNCGEGYPVCQSIRLGRLVKTWTKPK